MSTLASRDGSARVDLYIANAAPFAQPVLCHLRALVHRSVPEVEETVKWSRPFFLYRGALLCNIAAFKQHCSFGFWGAKMAEVLRASGVETTESSGSFGRIRTLGDLPPDRVLQGYLQQAVAIAATPAATAASGRTRKRKPEAALPTELLTALQAAAGAEAIFARLSASCRREYVDWIVGAKRPETRQRRAQSAVKRIAQGQAAERRA